MANLKPQTLRSPSGDELVVLSKADYEALVRAANDAEEDADDVAIYDARKADLEAGHDAPLPEAVTNYMRAGDSLLAALRKWRGETQKHVSLKTGLAQGYISELEAGRKTGTPETLRAIAEALDVDPAWLGFAK